MAGIPAGRTSSIKALEKSFVLQTEFLAKPRPRIVTSVALEGQVIHKVERTFDGRLETGEDLRAAEAAVASQHNNIAKKIEVNGADFVKQTRSLRISRADRLGVIPGVSYVADIGEKLAGKNPPIIYQQCRLILDIAEAVSSASRLGRFRAGAMISEQGKFIIDVHGDKAYLVSMKPDAEIGTVLKEVMQD